MNVYVEDVILDNFVIDYIILFLTTNILKTHTKKTKIIISALIGSVFSLLNAIFALQGFWLMTYKIAISVCLVLIILPNITFKKFLTTYFCFLFLTGILGGLCFGICFLFGEVSFYQNGELSYSLSLPMWLIITIVFVTSKLIIFMFNKIKNNQLFDNFTYSASIICNNKNIKTLAFLDTGNTLCDSQTQKPIVFLSYKQFHKLFENITLTNILTKKGLDILKKPHYVSASTINGQNDVLVFIIDTIILKQNKNKIVLKNTYCGLTFSNLDKKLNCGMLLNPKVIGEYNEFIG